MAEVKIKLNREGVRALLRSPEMLAVCKEHAAAARGRLGAGYAVTARTGTTRAGAKLVAKTHTARRENAKNNTMLKALR